MPIDHATAVRLALGDAVTQFLDTADAIDDSMWERPASDRWTVRQLVAHVVRGMAVLGQYLDSGLEPTGPALVDAAGYFRTALSMEAVHQGIADRAVEAAESAGDDLAAWARAVADEMLARAAATDDDRVLVHFAGWIPFDEYLLTRVAELVLHTFDLQLACGFDVEAPATALAVVNPFLLELADRADPRALAMALTGRRPPFPCNVFG